MSQAGRLPDFIIIGAMRAGTTTLWTYLNEHPDIYMAKKKEIGYFSDPKYQNLDLSWYTDLFSEARDNQLCAEASTVYSRWPNYGNVAERIYNKCPNIKLIYVLRNPIERAHSHYAYGIQEGKGPATFDLAIQNSNFYLDPGFYFEQIKQYLNYFSQDQIHCILHEDLVNDTNQTLIKTQEYLGLRITQLAKQSDYKVNSRGDRLLKKKLDTKLKNIPGASYIRKHLPTSFKKDIFNAVKNSSFGNNTLKEYKPQEISEKTRNHLKDLFEKPNKELEIFLGRDLSHWN